MLVATLGQTIQFDILVYGGTSAGAEPVISQTDASMRGVTRHKESCRFNDLTSQNECKYTVQWKSQCGTSSEDIGNKFSCLDPTGFLADNPESSLGGLDMRKCENRVCRLLCAKPDFDLKDKTGFASVESGLCTLPDGTKPDRCYKLNRKLHVGETLDFELEADSAISDDDVYVEAAAEPGIPIGMEFRDASSPGKGSRTRSVSWEPRPGQQGTSNTASFLAFTSTEQGCPLTARRIYIQIDVKSYDTKMTYSFDEGQYNSETNSETFAQFKNVIAARNIPIPAGSAGADIHLSMTAGQEVSGLDFKCMSNVDMTKGFQPIFELLNASIARSNSTEKMGGTCAENQCSRPETLAVRKEQSTYLQQP